MAGKRDPRKALPEPYAIWVVAVEAQHRLRLSREVGLVAKWLESEGKRIESTGTVGPLGGIQISPMGGRAVGVRAMLRSHLGQSFAGVDDVAAPWMDLARFAATAWKIPIFVEKTRYTLTLPEPARRLGILPNAGDRAVVFAAGEVLEVWPAAEWVEHIRKVGRNLDDVTDLGIDSLRSRSDEL